MKNMKMRLLSVVLSLCMITAMMPISVAAVDEVTVTDDAALATALSNADDGDTIILSGTFGKIVYSGEKSLNFVGTSNTVVNGGMLLYNTAADKEVTVSGITFEGSNLQIWGYADVTVEDNEFYNITSYVSDVNISNSGTRTYHAAITVRVSDPMALESVVITNNIVDGTADIDIEGNTGSGICVSGTTHYAEITGNKISNVAHNAINFGNAALAGDVIITKNELSNWAQATVETTKGKDDGSGRALRIKFTSTPSSLVFEENKMTNDNEPLEGYLKATVVGTNSVSVENNYWNGNDPANSTICSVEGEAPGNEVTVTDYFETEAEIDEILNPEPESTGFNILAFLLIKRFMTDYDVEIEVIGDGAVVTDDEDNKVRFSKDVTLTFTPADGAELLSVTINGDAVEVVDGIYTINNIKKDAKVVATFSEAAE